jgi:hypothetical protein
VLELQTPAAVEVAHQAEAQLAQQVARAVQALLLLDTQDLK